MMTKNSLATAMSKAAARTPHFGRIETPSSVAQPLPAKGQERPVIASSKRPPSRIGKKVISGYFDLEASKQLARLALDQGRSNEDLLREALNDLFTKYRLPPIT